MEVCEFSVDKHVMLFCSLAAANISNFSSNKIERFIVIQGLKVLVVFVDVLKLLDDQIIPIVIVI